jgi:hypothetical protein
MTPEQLQQRLEDAADTLRLLPEASGPQEYRSAWDTARRRGLLAPDECQEPSKAQRYRQQPSASAIAEMDETFAWLQLLDEPQDRYLLQKRSMLNQRGRKIWTWRKLAEDTGKDFSNLAHFHRRALKRLIALIPDQPQRVPKARAARKEYSHYTEETETYQDQPTAAYKDWSLAYSLAR